MRKSCIEIIFRKDETIINIDENIEHKKIIDSLKKKMTELKKLYLDKDTPILVTGKVLKNREIDEIQNIISEQLNVRVEFDSPKVLGLYGIKKTFNKEIDTSEAKFHKGSLRSGQRIEFEGSLIIIGDVNGGAEVIAGENIVILGTLRGLAHAGAKGNKNAIIAASAIEAPQIRIANKILERERHAINKSNLKTFTYINDSEEIILE